MLPLWEKKKKKGSRYILEVYVDVHEAEQEAKRKTVVAALKMDPAGYFELRQNP